MPNIFTPNGDQLNELFIPKEYNYIDSGSVVIFNRWGEKIYSDDIFKGWDGKNASPGIYFYQIYYIDQNAVTYKRKGTATLMR